MNRFSHGLPQASERWQRPAVKALVRTIHQELCDPELLGRLAPVCKELGTACVDEATRMLLGIDLPVEQVMPEERVLRTGSYRPKPSQKRPRGLFPRIACLRVLEGVRIRCDVNELAEGSGRWARCWWRGPGPRRFRRGRAFSILNDATVNCRAFIVFGAIWAIFLRYCRRKHGRVRRRPVGGGGARAGRRRPVEGDAAPNLDRRARRAWGFRARTGYRTGRSYTLRVHARAERR